VDNIAELTARANDEGWDYIFAEKWRSSDAVFVLSVGGGTDKVSTPLASALGTAGFLKCRIFGIVGKDGGITKEVGTHVVVIPTVNPKHITPHAEAFQLVILHCLVSHPDLQVRPTKW
jgi:D-sedoheptulose 7-phosphate isomerase